MEAPTAKAYPQHSRHSNSISSHDSSSVSSAGSGQTLVPPPLGLYNSSAASRSLPEPRARNSGPTRSPVGFASSEYRYHPYGTSSGSPSSITGSSIQEQNERAGSKGMSPTDLSGSHSSTQKRVYRERRKEPSCDACRERKVKCDATVASSCSECSSRSVPCEFTKETNRRMSSIKQVQDLQSQLAEARNQITQLRTLLQTSPPVESANNSPAICLSLPALGVSHSERQRAPYPMSNFDHVRRNLRKYSRGVFKIPPPHRQVMPTPLIHSAEIQLPPRHTVESLLANYHAHWQRQTPIIHWSSFLRQVEKIMTTGSFVGAAQIWTGMFHAVLACGTLHPSDHASQDVEGMKYVIIAARLLNTWTDNLLADHARTALLVSTFLYELNIRSAGWVWMGTAVRMSQEIGLELEEGPWSQDELEDRKRLFWAIVAQDRILSLTENRRPQVGMADDDLRWPSITDDHPAGDQSAQVSPEIHSTSSTISIMVPVIRFIGPLKSTMASQVISRSTLQTWDDYFAAIFANYPEQYQQHSDSYLEPFCLNAIIPLQLARFQLYRHNINSHSSQQERSQAIDRCVTVALETVRYFSRSMHMPSRTAGSSAYTTESWSDLLLASVDNSTCRHLWRCMLILCFRGEFNAALACLRVSRTIGEARKLNIACGRNLAFFLDVIIERVKGGSLAQQDFEADFELLAYASGDLQGDIDNAFVWAGSAPSHTRNKGFSPSDYSLTIPPFADEGLPASALLTEKEMKDWGGWDRVERQISVLMEKQQKHLHMQSNRLPVAQPQPPPSMYHRPGHNETKRLHLAPPEGTPSPNSASTPSAGASRISIANII